MNIGLIDKVLELLSIKSRDGSLVADLLPWAYFIDDGIVLNKNMSIQKTIYIKGRDFTNITDAIIESSVNQLNFIFSKGLGDGYVLYVDTQHYAENEYKESYYDAAASRLIEKERWLLYDAYPNYRTSNYVTIVYQFLAEKDVKTKDAFLGSGKIDVQRKQEIHDFKQVVNSIIGALEQVCTDVKELDNEETLGYLHNMISDKRMNRVIAPELGNYIDAYLPDVEIIPDPLQIGKNHIGVVSLYDYPARTAPLILYELEKLAVEYRYVQRYIAFSQKRGIEETRKRTRRWYGKASPTFRQGELADNISINKGESADEANQRVGSGELSFGFHSGTLIISKDDQSLLSNAIEASSRVFTKVNMIVRKEVFNAGQAWLGTLPGNLGRNPRNTIIHSKNLAHFFPLSGVWNGDAENQHLKKICGVGTPHVRCSSVGGNVFNLNLNVDDLGHTLVMGPPGAGKSTLLSFLTAQFYKYPHAQVIIFDKDRSAKAITQALGGIYYDLGGDNRYSLRLMPFSELADEQWKSFYVDYLRMILDLAGVENIPEHRKILGKALSDVVALDRSKFTLEYIARSVQEEQLRDVLKEYAQRWSSIIGEQEDYLQIDNNLITFEMSELMAKGELIVLPVLEYLFKRIDIRFTGVPTLLILDEAWLFLKHRVFNEKLQEWLKTLRKKNVFVVLATQELSDFTGSSINETIISTTATKIYLPNPNARSPVVEKNYKNIGLTDQEIELLSNLHQKRHYYYKSSLGGRVFLLDLGAVSLRLLTQSSEMTNTQDHINYVLSDIRKQSSWVRSELQSFHLSTDEPQEVWEGV